MYRDEQHAIINLKIRFYTARHGGHIFNFSTGGGGVYEYKANLFYITPKQPELHSQNLSEKKKPKFYSIKLKKSTYFFYFYNWFTCLDMENNAFY